jgi:hypothetical protein
MTAARPGDKQGTTEWGWSNPWGPKRPQTGTTATQGFFSQGAAFRGAPNFFARILRVKSNAQTRSSHETTYYFFGSQCTPGVWQSLAAFAPGPVVLVRMQKVRPQSKKPKRDVPTLAVPRPVPSCSHNSELIEKATLVCGVRWPGAGVGQSLANLHPRTGTTLSHRFFFREPKFPA